MPDGSGNSIIDLIIAVPFLLVAAVALTELIVEIVLWPVAVLGRLCRLLPCDLMLTETVRMQPQAFREREFALRLPSSAAAKRFAAALAQHVRQGGRLGDPAIPYWLAKENGKPIAGEDPWAAESAASGGTEPLADRTP